MTPKLKSKLWRLWADLRVYLKRRRKRREDEARHRRRLVVLFTMRGGLRRVA